MNFKSSHLKRLAICVLPVVLVGSLATVAVSASSVVAQSEDSDDGAQESSPRFRVYDFGSGSLDDRDDYIHCVAHIVGKDEQSEMLTLGPERCFQQEMEASEFAGVGAVSGSGGEASSFSIGVHYDGRGYTGASLRIVGTDCAGGGISLYLTAWDDVISSTLNGCPVIEHYAGRFFRPGGPGTPLFFDFGDRHEDTLSPGGDLDELDNLVSGILYKSSSGMRDPSLPVVNLVGMEVTQGTQDWLGSVALVRNRPTAVRAFFTTTATQDIGVSAVLRAHTRRGTTFREDFTLALNTGESITVNSDLNSIINPVDRSIDSSLNFVLPGEWTNLAPDEELFLSLDFSSDQNNFEINCREMILPANTCSATLSFVEVDPPTIVMFPVRLQVTNKDGSTSIIEPDRPILETQLRRIQAMMPFPNQMLTTPDNIDFRRLNYPLDFRPDPSNPDVDFFVQTTKDNQSDDFIDLDMVNDALERFWSDAGDIDAIYLGILPGEPASDLLGRAGYDRETHMITNVASWYTSGLDETPGEASSYLSNNPRNAGPHELGHVLQQSHTGRMVGNNAFVGFCGEEGANFDYPYAIDLFPTIDDSPYRDGLFDSGNEMQGDELPDNEFLPLLGPMGDPNEEVWGLDIDYMEDRYRLIEWLYQLNSLIVSDPREVYSIMSYCYYGLDNSNTQAIWMDSVYHGRIIEQLTQENPTADESQGVSDVMPSDMFFGKINFSDSDDLASGVVLDSIYSRPRQARQVPSGNYVLELRDNSGASLRSISFTANQPIPLVLLEPGESHPEENGPATFSFMVFDPPDYTSFAIKQNGRELLVMQRSANTPTVEVSGVSTNQLFSQADTINLSWVGADQDEDPLTYRVYYSVDGGSSYEPYSLETTGNRKAIEVSRLRGSDSARFGISVSDGTRSAFTESPVFRVANHAPEVRIESPSSGVVLAESQGFLLKASGYDEEDGSLGFNAYSWISSVNGNLGTGAHVVLSANQLAPGTHTITVTATDSSGLTATATTSIIISRVNTLPIAMDDSASVELDVPVFIDVLANDTDTERDIDSRSFEITVQPMLGEAEIAISPATANLAVRYVGHTSGRDSLTYQICDGVNRCDTAKVLIAVGIANCTIFGTEGDDMLVGTPGDDVICGLGGDDTIDGKTGNDTLLGGSGDDTIYGRLGHDVIRGGLGDDFILGHRGDDVIFGGRGDDEIYGGGGNDIIKGQEGSDELFGEAGNDIIEGGSGNDIIGGGVDDDTLRGGPGDDTIRGNAGKDTVFGGEGTDTILGVARDETVHDQP